MYDIDTERLINAVKIRPPLYSTVNDKMCKAPSSREHRDTLWHEIAEELHGEWSHISQLHKTQFVREVQKRWKSLRTCFTRELCMQRREQLKREANMSVKRRKRYEYFNKLTFLNDQCDESNDMKYTIQEDSHEHLDNDETPGYGEEFDTRPEVDIDNYQPARMCGQRNGVEQRFLDILEGLRRDDDNDDRHFVLSLLPYFKNMNEQKKLQARIEVLKVLQEKHGAVKIKEDI